MTDTPIMESLPVYIEEQTPQNPFDALLTRITAPLSTTHPNARVVLESFIDGQKAPTYHGEEDSKHGYSPKAIEIYPLQSDDGEVGKDETLLHVKQAIVDELFKAITREDNESVDLLIQHNMVTANVTSSTSQTPLLAAIMTKNLGMVKQLLGLGANPNVFGEVTVDGNDTVTRTPLMLASTLGSLPIVRLLVEPPHSANDALIAPDGQIALRLAVEHNHQTIVDLLPTLRAGGVLRFRTRNAHNIERAKKALRGIYYFIKVFVWDIPKFFLWSVPKHVIVLPGVRLCKWSWRNRKRFGNWCKRQVVEIPKKVWRGIKKIPDGIAEAWKFILKGLKKLGPFLWDLVKNVVTSVIDLLKALPEIIADIAKSLWKFITRTFPQWLKTLFNSVVDFLKALPQTIADIAKSLWEFFTGTLLPWLKSVGTWLWDFLTKSIPKAIRATVEWIWEGIKSSAKAIWEFLSSFVSFFHTVFIAIITFLKNVTLKDIWDAFCRILRSIFINIPKTLWSWLKTLSRVLYDILDALLGWFGRFLWEVGAALFRMITYIPKKLWTILESFADSMGKAAYEIRVWINPKA